MNSKPHRDEWFPPEPREEDLRLRAYELWLTKGQVHGRDLEPGFTARQFSSAAPVARRRKASTACATMGTKP